MTARASPPFAANTGVRTWPLSHHAEEEEQEEERPGQQGAVPIPERRGKGKGCSARMIIMTTAPVAVPI
jgi:hypothetical protein